MKPSRWLLLAVALLGASMLAGKLSASAGPYVPASDAGGGASTSPACRGFSARPLTRPKLRRFEFSGFRFSPRLPQRDLVSALREINQAIAIKQGGGLRSPLLISSLLERAGILREMGQLAAAEATLLEAESIANEKLDRNDRRHTLLQLERACAGGSAFPPLAREAFS